MTGAPGLHGQAGVATVWFILTLTAVFAAATLAIDVSNLFRIKRQLQMQADAAVLAGGTKLQITGCSDTEILAEADDFVGVSTSTWNKPESAAAQGRVSNTYEATPSPCSALALETTVRETAVPFAFPLGDLVDMDVSATARVELNQIAAMRGSLPIALPEPPEVKGVIVDLIDESKPATDPARLLNSKQLSMGAEVDGVATWSNVANPLSHNVTQSNLGFRVRVLYGSATACTDVNVKCYDADATGNGLLHVHGFEQPASAVTTNSPPVLKRVTFAGGGCADNGFFSEGGCSVTVRATVDWVNEVEGASNPGARADITGTLGGASLSLTHKTGQTWEGTVNVPASAGPLELKLGWVQKAGRVMANPPQVETCANGSAQCAGVWKGDQALGVVNKAPGVTIAAATAATPVHRAFSATTARSGPISFARALEGGAITNSVDRCKAGETTCNHDWVIELGLPAPLSLGSKRTLTIALPGSNDGHLECDPNNVGGTDDGASFRDEMANGCAVNYAINPGDDCPEPSEQLVLPEPWDCVLSSTGDRAGQFSQGMNMRIYDVPPPGSGKPTDAVCSARRNYYPNWTAGDPRIVTVMIVRPPNLEDAGNSIWPVKDFGQFYVTGWGDNGSPACPVSTSLNDPAGSGELVGYFIKYVRPNDGDVWGDAPCNPTQLGGCVPVMTK